LSQYSRFRAAGKGKNAAAAEAGALRARRDGGRGERRQSRAAAGDRSAAGDSAAIPPHPVLSSGGSCLWDG
jgi:hypothetical protein